MTVRKFVFSLGLMFLVGATPALAEQSSGAIQGSPVSMCEVHVWQSNLFKSDNMNAVGGLIGGLVEDIVDRSAPPKSVTEQMEQNLGGEDLAKIVRNLDWSRYVGGRPVSVRVETDIVDEKALSLLERSPVKNAASTSNCHIELYVGKQTFKGGMKTWLFSKFGVRIFDAGKYQGSHGMAYTHVKNFPAKSAASYPLATDEIRGGFARNLTKFLDKRLAVHT
jgi:hypothetical protein